LGDKGKTQGRQPETEGESNLGVLENLKLQKEAWCSLPTSGCSIRGGWGWEKLRGLLGPWVSLLLGLVICKGTVKAGKER